MAAYANARKKLRTGDVVLFSGKGGISTGIKWFTNSKWSHVGMVVRVPEWDMVLLWESTTLSNVADIQSGKAVKGVQLVSLSDRLKTYDGAVSVRRLDGVERDATFNNTLTTLRRELQGRPYERDETELLLSAVDGFGLVTNDRDLSSLFCSEMVAEAYQRLGLLPKDPPSNEYTPRDFDVNGAVDKALQRGRLLKPTSLQRVQHELAA